MRRSGRTRRIGAGIIAGDWRHEYVQILPTFPSIDALCVPESPCAAWLGSSEPIFVESVGWYERHP